MNILAAAKPAIKNATQEADVPRSFYAAICDLNGIFRGKRLPSSKLSSVLDGGTRMPMSSIGVDIWGTDVAGTCLTMERGDLDGICHPTGRVLSDLGWAKDADQPLLHLWMSKEDGSPYYADARHMLAEILKRFAALELRPVVATEVEFYLLDPAADPASPASFNATNRLSNFDDIYSISELAETSAFLDEIYARAAACDIQVEAATAEGAPRQFEFNLLHQADALKAADDTILFKQIIRNTAQNHGFRACFMAKPFQFHAGSGMHVHFSIIDKNGQNIFDDGSETGSDALKYAVGGLLDSMAEMTLAFAPHLNSYRRLCPGGLAPTTVAWGYENRTSALRIPAGPCVGRRIEHRVAGADANPYIVLAAMLGGALYGLQNKMAPAAPVSTNSHELDLPCLARDWNEALRQFENSAKVKTILHPEFVEAFAACKQQEQDIFAARITEFELQTYRTSV